jgi:hypothetical protein
MGCVLAGALVPYRVRVLQALKLEPIGAMLHG